MGIGLSLARALVALHNGKIEVQSTLGSGTVFTIVLPILKSQPLSLNENDLMRSMPRKVKEICRYLSLPNLFKKTFKA